MHPGAAINVSAFATGGDGTPASPWTGWDTEVAWAGTPGKGNIVKVAGTLVFGDSKTQFQSDFLVGEYIVLPSLNNAYGEIQSIQSDQQLTVAQWTGVAPTAPTPYSIYVPAAYYFPTGTYAYDTAPNWGLPRIRLYGDGAGPTVLQFNGTGIAVRFENDNEAGVRALSFEGFKIVGSPQCTIGVYLHYVHNSAFTDIYVRECTVAAYLAEFTVQDVFDNVRYSCNEELTTTVPLNAFWLYAYACTFINISAAGIVNPALNGVGIRIAAGSYNTFVGGASQGNNYGVVTHGYAAVNTFVGVDFEQGPFIDAAITAKTTFVNCNSQVAFNMATTLPATGTIVTDAAAKRVLGTNTQFLAEIMPGQTITCGASSGAVAKIIDDQTLTLTGWSGSDITAPTPFTIGTGGGGQNSLIDGTYTAINIDAASGGNKIVGSQFATLNDSSQGTYLTNVWQTGVGTVPTTIVDHLQAKTSWASAPTITSASGIGSGSVTVDTNSSDFAMLLVLAPDGDPDASGTIGVQFMKSFGANAPVIVVSLMDGSEPWFSSATVRVTAASGNTVSLAWNNAGVPLAAGQTYRIAVIAIQK